MNWKRLRKIFFETDYLPWLRLSNIFPWLLVIRFYPWLGSGESFRRYSSYWRYMFLHQLSACVEAGIALPRAIEFCARESLPRRMRAAMKKIKAALEDGQLLSDALRRYAPTMLPRSLCGVVAIGEESGQLSDALKIISRRYLSLMSQRQKAVAMLVYPIILIAVSILIVSFLLIKVIPTCAEIYSDLGGQLPLPTQVLLNVSNFILSNTLVTCMALAGICSAPFSFFLSSAESDFREKSS